MILNISGEPFLSTVSFHPINLGYGNYTLALNNFIGYLNSPMKAGEVFEISTNLITRDDANPHRIVDYLFVPEGSNIVSYKPTHLLEYKLRVLELSNAEIKFRGLSSDIILEFSQVAAQFIISETYGRF